MEKKSTLDASTNALYPKLGEALQMKNVNGVIMKYCSVRELSSINNSNKLLNVITNESPRWKEEIERLYGIINRGQDLARGKFYKMYADGDVEHPQCDQCDGFVRDGLDTCGPCFDVNEHKFKERSNNDYRLWAKRDFSNKAELTAKGICDYELMIMRKRVEEGCAPDIVSDYPGLLA